jgi:zinc protease
VIKSSSCNKSALDFVLNNAYHSALTVSQSTFAEVAMNRVALLLLTLLVGGFMLSSSVLAQDTPQLKFEKYVLPNGLNVILHEDHALPTITVDIWYHVGSKNEKRGRTGFAHLFEHLMFEGSEHYPQDPTKLHESLGGDNNASTSEDRTNYFVMLPSNCLEIALWLEADRMGYLPPAITQEKLDIQRDVVKNERRQRMDNQPYAKSEEILLSALYPAEHPYSWPIIGSMEDLSAASLDDVKEFFRTYYSPSNASLCIAGDFDPLQAKALVEKHFAPLPAGPAIDRMQTWVPQLEGVKRYVAQDRVSLPRLYMVWTTPAQFTPGDAELDLFANALASGKSSRFYKTLVYEKQIAQDVSAYQSSGELCGTFNIEVTAKPGHTLTEIEEAVDAILKDALKTGITSSELTQAQTNYEAGFFRGLQMNFMKAERLNNYNTFLGDPGKLEWDLNRYRKANVEAVNRVARENLDLGHRVLLQIVPQGDLKTTGTEFDRTQQPPVAAEPNFLPPVYQREVLPNGLTLLLVEKHDLPLVQTNLVFKSGWAADPQDKPGIAAVTADMLDEGTVTRGPMQISEEAKALGAQLRTGSSFDGSSVSLNVLKKNMDPGLALMADVVMHPRFAGEELERLRKDYLGRITQESRQPMTVARKVFGRLLFGAGHPYAQPYTGSGTDASIKAVTRDDLVNFYKAKYSPKNAAIVVVGDITMADAKAKIMKAFDGWSGADVPVSAVPEPAVLSGTKIYIIDKPGAPQSALVCGNVAIARTDPDYVACDVLGNALGGQFTSRINSNLREEKGYTYGAHAQFSPRRGKGAFTCYAEVQTPATDKSVTEIIKELRDVGATRPLSDAELSQSRSNLAKGFPQSFETFMGVAGELQEIYQYDLPTDEWSTYARRVNAVSQPEVTQAASTHLHPNALLFVIVGDREKIEPALKKLNVGEVTVIKPEDL